MDILSSNNAIGWLHYYIAHLMRYCGVTTMAEVIRSVQASTTKVDVCLLDRFASTANLSDNECIMLGNKWTYYWQKELKCFSHTDPLTNKTVTITINKAAVKWWMR